MPSENLQGQQKIFQNTQRYANSLFINYNLFIFSYILKAYPSKWAMSVQL